MSRPHVAHAGIEDVLFEQQNGLHHAVHGVDGVIHRLDEILDVVAVEGGDEAPTNGQQHFAGDAVGLVFKGDDLGDPRVAIIARQKSVQRVGGGDDSFGMLGEQIEELLFVWEELTEPLEHGLALFFGLFGSGLSDEPCRR